MSQRKRFVLTGTLGLLSLLAGAGALVVFQACFAESFWLHAMIAPLNPRTIFQPTPFDYAGDIFQLLIPLLLLAGLVLLLTSIFFFIRGRQTARQAG